MNAKKISRIAAAVLSMTIAANAPPVYAEGNDTYEMSVPFSVTDGSGSIPQGTLFRVEMAAENNAPLPEMSYYQVNVSGEYEFGPIVFDEPGDYEYTIREVVYDNENIVFDETIYHVYAAVLWDDSQKLVGGFALTAGDTGEKPSEVDFENEYLPPRDDSSKPDDGKDDSRGQTTTDDSSDTPTYTDDSTGQITTDESSDVDTSTSQGERTTDDSSGSDVSGSSSSRSDSSGSSQSSSSKPDDSSKPTFIGSILAPNTGGGAALTLSGLVIPMMMIFVFGRRRKEDGEDGDASG